MGLEKRKEQVEEIGNIEKGRLWDSFFFIIQNPLSIWGNSKFILEQGFEGFWRSYMNSLNLIYVVIIFLK